MKKCSYKKSKRRSTYAKRKRTKSQMRRRTCSTRRRASSARRRTYSVRRRTTSRRRRRNVPLKYKDIASAVLSNMSSYETQTQPLVAVSDAPMCTPNTSPEPISTGPPTTVPVPVKEGVIKVSNTPTSASDMEQRKEHQEMALQNIGEMLQSFAPPPAPGRQRVFYDLDKMCCRLTEQEKTLITIGLEAVLRQEEIDKKARIEAENKRLEEEKRRIARINFYKKVEMVKNVCIATFGVATTAYLIATYPEMFIEIAKVAFVGIKYGLRGTYWTCKVSAFIFGEIAKAAWNVVYTLAPESYGLDQMLV